MPNLQFMLAGAFTFYLVTLLLIPLAFAIPYAILRFREGRGERPYPQLGLKSAFHYFYSIGLIVVLTGLTIFIFDMLWLTPQLAKFGGKWFNSFRRTYFAVTVGGLIVMVLHLILVKTVTDDRPPAARRMFLGWRLIIHGLVVVSAIILFMVVLFQEGNKEEGLKTTGSILLVWVPSWIIHLVLLAAQTRRLYEPDRLRDVPDEGFPPVRRREI